MLAPEDLVTPLDLIAASLEETGWAAEIYDAEWKLAYATTQLREIVGSRDDDEIGIGRHILDVRGTPFWEGIIASEFSPRWLADNVPQILADDPSAGEELAAKVRPEFAAIVREAEPAPVGAWTALINLRSGGARLGPVRYFGVRARGPDGAAAATLYIYGSSLPAQLLAMVSRGRVAHFERMARLVQPGRREAAILFADVESSGALSRRLPSSTYFEFMRRFSTAADDAIIDGGGVVGDHAGDGITAFFVVDDLGAPSAAARAAIQVGRAMQQAIEDAGVEAGLAPGEVLLNIGLHWGATLYMGQVVTGGRLEVTALGDEVNECARVEQTASDGALLATKSLIEHLDPADAETVAVTPAAVAYRALRDFAGVDEKAIRDAGLLGVTPLQRA